MRSLTITYFHTGIRTIIGVESFHGPVRDGKGWYQLAMVIRHEGVLRWGLVQRNQSGEEVVELTGVFKPERLVVTGVAWVVFSTGTTLISTLACHVDRPPPSGVGSK